jgi:hypothetical protein
MRKYAILTCKEVLLLDKRDKFGIFRHARSLIETHMQYDGGKTDSPTFFFGPKLPPACDDCKNPSNDVDANFKQVQEKLILFVANAAKPLKTASDITGLFRDSCFGLSMLGLRYNALYEKVMGKPKDADEVLLSNTIRKDVIHSFCRIRNDSEHLIDDIFNSLPGEFISGPYDMIDQLVCTAYQGYRSLDDDLKVLAAVYLLNHLRKTGAKMDLGRLTCVFSPTSCANFIVRGSWKNHSIIGYFDADKPNEYGCEFINAPNRGFVEIFTGKLDALFSIGAPDDYMAIRLRRTLAETAATAYFKYSNDALHAFQAVNDVINMHERNEIITEEQVDSNEYRSNIYRAIALPKNDIVSGATYELNTEGLLQFCDMVDALGLSGDMPGFTEIATRIRAL